MQYKQAIVVRTDLGMGKGKMAAQAAHAAVLAAQKSSYRGQWMLEGQKKVVLRVSGLEGLLAVMRAASMQGLSTAMVEDAGLTQISSGTKTAVGIGPAPEKEIDSITGGLKLL